MCTLNYTYVHIPNSDFRKSKNEMDCKLVQKN